MNGADHALFNAASLRDDPPVRSLAGGRVTSTQFQGMKNSRRLYNEVNKMTDEDSDHCQE